MLESKIGKLTCKPPTFKKELGDGQKGLLEE